MPKLSDLTNYKLLSSTTLDSGLVANIYQDAVEMQTVNLVMLSISAEPYRIEQRILLKEALDMITDQTLADYDDFFQSDACREEAERLKIEASMIPIVRRAMKYKPRTWDEITTAVKAEGVLDEHMVHVGKIVRQLLDNQEILRTPNVAEESYQKAYR